MFFVLPCFKKGQPTCPMDKEWTSEGGSCLTWKLRTARSQRRLGIEQLGLVFPFSKTRCSILLFMYKKVCSIGCILDPTSFLRLSVPPQKSFRQAREPHTSCWHVRVSLQSFVRIYACTRYRNRPLLSRNRFGGHDGRDGQQRRRGNPLSPPRQLSLLRIVPPGRPQGERQNQKRELPEGKRPTYCNTIALCVWLVIHRCTRLKLRYFL